MGKKGQAKNRNQPSAAEMPIKFSGPGPESLMEAVCKRASASGSSETEMLRGYFRVFGISIFGDQDEIAKQVFGDDSAEIQKAEAQKRKPFGWDRSSESVKGALVFLRHLAEVIEREALRSVQLVKHRQSPEILLGLVETMCFHMNWRMPTLPDVTRIRTSQHALEFVRAVEAWIDGRSATIENPDDVTLRQSTEKTEKLSNALVSVKAAYEWAISAISGADDMTISELFDAIQTHQKMPSDFLDQLPNNADTFATYLRRAGIRRYRSSGSRVRRSSRHPKK